MEEEQHGEKHLVCTALEEVFPEKGQIYYLGEWCKLFSKNKTPKINEVHTFDYHWDDKVKFNEDFDYLNSFYEQVLEVFSVFLNKHHNIKKPTIYWRIIIGYWLGYAIQVLFDRYENLRNLKDQRFTSVFLEEEESFIVPSNTENFAKLVTEDRWNSYLYYSILKNINHNFKINLIKKNKTDFIKQNTIKNRLKKLLLKKYQFLLKYLNNSKSPLILTTYLSKTEEFLLNLKFNCLPYFINPFDEPTFEPKMNIRKFKLNLKCENEFESLTLHLLPKLIPLSFLEGYNDLASNINNFVWPSNPKFIYTSNSFFFDEKFKFYCAENKSKGVKLFIGQHGGSYGIVKKSFSENHQLSISDNFFSWGWTSKEYGNKIISKGVLTKFKNFKRKPSKLLIVTTALPRYSHHLFSSSKSSQFLSYTNDQFNFIKSLESSVKNEIIVRLIKKDYGWDQSSRYLDEFPNLKIDMGEENISKLFSITKLYIGTYNATSFLEALFLNIPSVIYWDLNQWEIRDDAKVYFENLKKVKVFHDNPFSAADHVNEIYNNVDEWWNSYNVVKEVSNFRKRFCDYRTNVVSEIEDSINKLI